MREMPMQLLFRTQSQGVDFLGEWMEWSPSEVDRRLTVAAVDTGSRSNAGFGAGPGKFKWLSRGTRRSANCALYSRCV